MDKKYHPFAMIEHFGLESQENMLIEEMSELTKELCKKKRGLKHNIIEEIVDVQIVLEQIITVLNTEELKKIKNVKIRRLEKMLNEA